MSASRILADLHARLPLVNPSLLACDFGHLAHEIQRCEAAGAQLLHLDIMDGHFVPNLSFGLPIVQAIRRATRLPLDVHLMISQPERYVKQFREAGANLITIHIEVVPEPRPLLEQIRDLGAGAGISLNPPTPLESIEGYLDVCDLVLVMSVMPGFGGQEFDPVALEKLRRLRQLIGGRVLLSVDGGVHDDTIAACVEAGADLLVIGTGFFAHQDYVRRMAELLGLAKSHKDVHV
jgi:ribulose-phosphate 3-epimerase